MEQQRKIVPPIPIFALIIDRNFVQGEERFLEEIFGERTASTGAACVAGYDVAGMGRGREARGGDDAPRRGRSRRRRSVGRRNRATGPVHSYCVRAPRCRYTASSGDKKTCMKPRCALDGSRYEPWPATT